MTPPLALSQTAINFTYLVAAVLLIVGIRRLSSPPTARSGNWIAAVGMGIAIFFTFLDEDITSYWLIVVGMAVGTVIGVVSARLVKMTAMPQMVALFNGVGGGRRRSSRPQSFTGSRLRPATSPATRSGRCSSRR